MTDPFLRKYSCMRVYDDILFSQVSRHSRGNINKQVAEQSVCIYYYMHKTAAPIREAVFLRPIKNSRIRDKAQFREHRLRTNKVVHVCWKCAVSQRFMEESTLCSVPCTDFTTSLKRILHFGSCSRLFTKHRPVTYTVFCDWGSGRLYPVDEANSYNFNPSCSANSCC